MRRFISLIPAILIAIVTLTWTAAVAKAEPRVNVNLSGHPIRGAANAPVTIVVFSDYL
ncbi:hypothetical protein [Geomonas sp.]|uniref:hypothetical protein n=1 Tax=Geomonas sp. TaxID=2651584 RepID=UPI002B465C8B|nr:hypothetical protein [Geomonas sp.]HJV33757.1 hypothetical protein [Geomonas sp.]